MNAPARIFRLLPAVILVGAAVLVLKSEGLVKTAWAQEQPAGAADQAVLAQDTAPMPADITADSGQTSSAAQVDVLNALAKRRAELDARAADIKMQSDELTAAEARVDAKIATLKQLQDQIQSLLTTRDTQQQKQIADLVKTYKNMDAGKAAIIFNTMPDEVLIPVAVTMSPADLANIMNKMNPDAAQKLSVKLANRLKLPATAAPDGQCLPTPSAAIAPGQQTASAAAPGAPPPTPQGAK